MYDIIKSMKDEASLVLFLGDCIKDFSDFEYIYSNIRFIAVRGNCDYNADVPDERIVEVAGKKIFMSHGHRYRVKLGHGMIGAEAKTRGVDICLFGHSHSPLIMNENGVQLMNPGSISEPRGASEYPCYGVIKILDAKVDLRIVEVR